MTKFKKMTKGKQAAIIIASILAAALLIGIIVSAFMPKPGVSVNLVEVTGRNMSEKLSISGQIESDGDTVYSIYSGTKVLKVNVKEGDTVKKGDVLASFDSSSAAAEVAKKQQSYNEAKKAYDAAVAQKTDAAKQSAAAEKRIAELEKKIAALEKELAAMGGNVPELPSIDIDAILEKIPQMTEEEIRALLEAIMNSAPTDGLEQLGGAADKVKELLTYQTELARLQVEKELLKSTSQFSFEDILKIAVETTASDLQRSKQKQQTIAKGWVASSDGLVTKVNVKEGEVFGSESSGSPDMSQLISAFTSGEVDMSSLMGMLGSLGGSQAGMVVSDTSQYVATFFAGKYDILKLQLGQKAKIKTVGGTFDGEIIYISPTAQSSGGTFDLGSITSGLTGGSSAGCKVKVSIKEPDRSVIAGFDVDIDIMLGESKNVLSIPVEALIPDSKTKSVYVYDSESGTVSIREVVFGTNDDNYYEVKAGLKEGELIVKNPPSELADGVRVTPAKTASK